MEIDYSILYLILVFLAFLGLFFIGFNISSSIEIQGNYIIFWIMYLVTIISFFTMGFSIYFHYTIEKKRGPPGPQGETGETGIDGDKGKCDEDCNQGLCYKIIINAIQERLVQLLRDSGSEVRKIRINNIYIKNKINEMCKSDEFEALKKYKSTRKIVDKLKEIWVGKDTENGTRIKGWVDLLYESGTYLYFENMGAHHEFDWSSNENPWDEIMKSDYYYMGLNEPGESSQYNIIPPRKIDEDGNDYCTKTSTRTIEPFQVSSPSNTRYEVKFPYVNYSEDDINYPPGMIPYNKQKSVYTCPDCYEYKGDDTNPYKTNKERDLSTDYYTKKRDDLKYSIYPDFILLTDLGSIESLTTPGIKLNYELTEKSKGIKYTSYNLYKIKSNDMNDFLHIDTSSNSNNLICTKTNNSTLCKFNILFENENSSSSSSSTSTSTPVLKLYLKYHDEGRNALYLNVNNRPTGSGSYYSLSPNKHYFKLNKTDLRNERINVDFYPETWNHGKELKNIRYANSINNPLPVISYSILEGKPIKSFKIKASNCKVSLLYRDRETDKYEVAKDKYKKEDDNQMEYTLMNEPINFEYEFVDKIEGPDIDYSKFAIKIEEYY